MSPVSTHKITFPFTCPASWPHSSISRFTGLKSHKYLLKCVWQLHNVIHSHLPSINVTICCRVLAESRGEVSMALWERYRKKGRKKESILIAVIMPTARIVQSVVQDYCDMVQTSANRTTYRKTCPNTTLPITKPIWNGPVSNLPYQHVCHDTTNQTSE